MVSIRDVAAKANVSVSTVSKTINGYDDISNETKEKIFAVMKDLQYLPNVSARRLSSRKTKTIGFSLEGLVNSDGLDGILFQIMSGIYRRSGKSAYEVIGIRMEPSNDDFSYDNICQAYNLDGVIIQGLEKEARELILAGEISVPAVFVNDKVVDPRVSSVVSDNVSIGYTLGSHLLALGHRSLLFVNGSQDNLISLERFLGFQKAVSEFTDVVYTVVYGNFQEKKAYEVVKEYLRQSPLVSAIFCASDLMAIGALRAVKALGYRVPEDVAIVGIDGIVLTDYTVPTITTVKQNFGEIGTLAFDVIKEMIENNCAGKVINVPFKLEYKNST